MYISLLLGSQISIINLVWPELQCQQFQLQYNMYISIQMHTEPLVLSCFLYLGVYNCYVYVNYELARISHSRIKAPLTGNQRVFPFWYEWHQIERFLSSCLVPNRQCAPGETDPVAQSTVRRVRFWPDHFLRSS